MQLLWKSKPTDNLEIENDLFTTSIVYVTKQNLLVCHTCAIIIIYRELKLQKNNIVIGSGACRDMFIELYDTLFEYCSTFENYYEAGNDRQSNIIKKEHICDTCLFFCTIVQTRTTKFVKPSQKPHINASYFILARNRKMEIDTYLENIHQGDIFSWEFFKTVKFASESHIYDENIRYDEDFWCCLSEAKNINPSDIYRQAERWYKDRKGFAYRPLMLL